MQISISVIIPVYNVEKHLKECLDTLLNQTFKDIEIIAIDDMSTDNSFDILQEYAANDARILTLRNPYNISAARTRNIGIQLSRGKYLAILDADDFFELDFLEKMFSEAERTKADLTLCGFYEYINKTKTDLPYNFLPAFLKKKICNPFDSKDISKALFKIFAGFAVVPFNKLILRSFLMKYDINFQDLPNSNDIFFGSAVLIYSKKISYIDSQFIHKRSGWGGNIESHRYKNPLSLYEALQKLYNTLKSNPEFNVYLPSFNSYVLDSIRYVFSIINKREEFLNFWQKKGFSSLGMLNLSKNDFLNVKHFYHWQLISQKTSIHDEDFGIVIKEIYENFFNELKSRNFKAAVWGYGLEGTLFTKMAKLFNYNLIEVYDKNVNKHQLEPIPVKLFENRNKKVNTIIVTNTYFSKEIAKEVKKVDANIKIFDFSEFLEYGITFEKCEI